MQTTQCSRSYRPILMAICYLLPLLSKLQVLSQSNGTAAGHTRTSEQSIRTEIRCQLCEYTDSGAGEVLSETAVEVDGDHGAIVFDIPLADGQYIATALTYEAMSNPITIHTNPFRKHETFKIVGGAVPGLHR